MLLSRYEIGRLRPESLWIYNVIAVDLKQLSRSGLVTVLSIAVYLLNKNLPRYFSDLPFSPINLKPNAASSASDSAESSKKIM